MFVFQPKEKGRKFEEAGKKKEERKNYKSSQKRGKEKIKDSQEKELWKDCTAIITEEQTTVLKDFKERLEKKKRLKRTSQADLWIFVLLF